MAKGEMTILTNMCMICDDHGNVLVQDKCGASWNGLMFPGGHVEPGESLTEAVIREIREETGLEIQAPVLCGMKHFYTREQIRYLVFLYKTNRFTGTLRGSEEGNVFWLPLADYDKYKWATDFDEMFRMFLRETPGELFYARDSEGLQRTVY